MSLPSDPPPAGAYPPFDPRPWYGQRPGTNGMAIAALVCGPTVPPLGLIFGLVALDQLKRSGTGGYGLALAGAIVGSVLTAFFLIYLILIVVLFASLSNGLGAG